MCSTFICYTNIQYLRYKTGTLAPFPCPCPRGVARAVIPSTQPPGPNPLGLKADKGPARAGPEDGGVPPKTKPDPARRADFRHFGKHRGHTHPVVVAAAAADCRPFLPIHLVSWLTFRLSCPAATPLAERFRIILTFGGGRNAARSEPFATLYCSTVIAAWYSLNKIKTGLK